MGGTSDPETGFLEQLGQRVRNMRALRGMSRKVLAKVSGISERYIAQLEAAKAMFRSCCCGGCRTRWAHIWKI